MKEVKPFQALIIHDSHRYYFNNNKNIFELYAVYWINTGLPSQFELAGILHFNHEVFAGASYKQHFWYLRLRRYQDEKYPCRRRFVLAQQRESERQAKLKEEADEKKLRDERNRILKEQQRRADAAAKARMLAEKDRIERDNGERARQATLENKNAAVQVQQEVQPHKIVEDPDNVAEGEALEQRIAEETLAVEETVVSSTVREGSSQEEEAQLERPGAGTDDPTPPVANGSPASSVRHEFVKQGNHARELVVSEYVIVGLLSRRKMPGIFRAGCAI